VAGALLNIERNELGLDYYREYAGKIRTVRRQDVQAVAAKFVDPERLAIAIAGPR
jgi:predicted Zn-dependent peptidase